MVAINYQVVQNKIGVLLLHQKKRKKVTDSKEIPIFQKKPINKNKWVRKGPVDKK